MNFALPGLGGSEPAMPESPPPVVTREDPAIAEARERERLALKRRKGRQASILAGEVSDDLGSVSRPQARGAQLLGE